MAELLAILAEHMRRTARNPELIPRTDDVHLLLGHCLTPRTPEMTLIEANRLVSFGLVVLIWLVQVIIYPAFAEIAPNGSPAGTPGTPER